MAELDELGDYIKLPVRTYSTDTLTRLVFAIATALEPGILLPGSAVSATHVAKDASRRSCRAEPSLEVRAEVVPPARQYRWCSLTPSVRVRPRNGVPLAHHGRPTKGPVEPTELPFRWVCRSQTN
jgi:hypothetical protein